MKTITYDGKLDHLFRDDRDSRIESLDVKARLPSFGSAGLVRPDRALTPEEIELINRIGMPPRPDERD